MAALTERLVDRRLGFGADEPYVRERDLRVPLSDGVVLLADLYRAPGPPPTVGRELATTPFLSGGARVRGG